MGKKTATNKVKIHKKDKKKVLIFSSRGITARHRYLMRDIQKLIPAHRTEPKLDDKNSITAINEILQLRSCSSCAYFEVRRHKDLYLWIGVANGPTAKFQTSS
ncbi:MAG: putative ribosome biogenesis protein brx1 [Streblomastix strix]|uniref:Putative ribosome biogenesis protein brx1 n=1 Tax=Streblomastix strix TaxID=222440 RepID=A0A5J4QTI7_9EUKA|nr:MAG: putative ribosome biogenesis protein brx1 [Streblomastix strix]